MSLLASVIAQIIRAAVGPVEIPWTPAEITTALWLDAADETTITIATGISEWADKSGNSHNVTQAGTTAQPLHPAAVLNDLPVARFDGSNDNLRRAVGTSLGQNVGSMMIFSVRKWDTAPTAERSIVSFARFEDASVRANMEGGRTSGRGQVGGRRLDANSFQTIVTAGSVSTSFAIQAGVWDYANSDLYQYINGALDGSSTSFQTAGTTSNTSSSALCIGAGPAGASEFFDGDLAEVLIVHSDITTATRQRIEGYLAWKWGLAGDLPVGHPYKNAAPTTAWTPADGTSALWLDAADATTITEVSSAVSEWADKSGNARNATQGTAGLRPSISSLNGAAAMLLDADYLSLASNLAGVRAAFWVSDSLDGSVTASLVTALNVSPIIGENTTTGSHAFVLTTLDDYDVSIDGSVSATGNASIDGGTLVAGGNIDLGVSIAGKSAAHLWYADWTSAQGFTDIGRLQTAAQDYRLKGKIAEVVLLTSVPDTATRQRIEGYLAWKWGLEANLPPGHPYELAAPTV